LPLIQKCVRVLAVKTQADLAIGDSAAALDDFMDIMQGCRALTYEPFAISVEHKVSSLYNGIVAIGKGLREHQWSDVQLASIEIELEKADITADYSRFLTGQRAQFNDHLGNFATSSYLERKANLDKLMGRKEGFDWIFALLPPGYLRFSLPTFIDIISFATIGTSTTANRAWRRPLTHQVPNNLHLPNRVPRNTSKNTIYSPIECGRSGSPAKNDDMPLVRFT
jgi:hypothetical protein